MDLSKIDPWILGFSAITVIITIIMGFRSAKSSKSASDFFVAGRSVSVGWNASAISGEYLSAASFMGIAGMVMSSGYDALWYPVCYACGYLFLLLFIAGPLRRFGAYTIPDFAEGRYDSPIFRKIAVCFVLFIGFFYTMPQMKGAGTTLAYIFQSIDLRTSWLSILAPHDEQGNALVGLAYWFGVAVVGAVITLNVSLGGMKGITLVQAVQYWIKMFAISVPVFVLLAVYGGYGKNLELNHSAYDAASPPPIVRTVDPAPSARLVMPEKIAPKDEVWIAPFGPLTSKAAKAAGLSAEESRPYSLLYTFSLVVALVCGTAGLPHILVRFYTNPDGVAAKKTTMWVMILIGVFYVFPPIFGVLGRNFLPDLYTGLSGIKGTDQVVLKLPILIREKYGMLGSILSGITCAGAFAAFMSTFSGLLVSMTGALAHDVYGRMLRPNATAEDRMKMFKWCAVLVGGVSVLLGSLVEPLEINFMVGQAFAIAAASYFPLLFMSVWWRGMTMKGAATGMLTGGLCALTSAAVVNVSTLALDKGPMGKLFAGFNGINDFWKHHPLLRILCEQPAIWSVPLSIGLMILVSKATRSSIPKDVRMKMLVLHAPEALGLKQEYIQEHQGAAH